MSEVKQKTLDQLKSDLQTALASNDEDKITAASQALVNFQREQAKQALEKARVEEAKLAGVRTELATELTKIIKDSPLGKANFTITIADIKLAQELVKLVPDVVKRVEAVKGTCVKFMLPDEQSDKARVAVAVIPSKRSSGSGSGGKRGKLIRVFDAHATAEEKTALAEAIATARAVNPDCRVDGIEYQHRSKVYKRAVAEGKVTPA